MNVIEIENLSKSFRISGMYAFGIKNFLLHPRQALGSLRGAERVVLDGINLAVSPGEAVGVIGRNGSGKSTLLTLIAGALMPTRGTVRTHGRIGSLLELGASLCHDLTGRENILLNGVLLGGTRREMRDRAGDIIEFSELGGQIEEPIRTYSSGMIIRLAFAVATHIDPQILLIDEALAVGDVPFQQKCFDKMMEFRRKGVAAVLVSHDLQAVNRFCDRAIWLDDGRVRAQGRAADVTGEFLNHTRRVPA
jgi:ABC-type polysaccharide/polyol phosphate transport system ATPase subunit